LAALTGFAAVVVVFVAARFLAGFFGAVACSSSNGWSADSVIVKVVVWEFEEFAGTARPGLLSGKDGDRVSEHGCRQLGRWFSKKPALVQVEKTSELLVVKPLAVTRHGSGCVWVNDTGTRLTAGLRGSGLPRSQTNRGRELMWRKVGDWPGAVNGIFSGRGLGGWRSALWASLFAMPRSINAGTAMNRLTKTVLALAVVSAGAVGGYFAMQKRTVSQPVAAPLSGWRAQKIAGLSLEAPGDFENNPLDLGAAQQFIETSEMQVFRTAGFEIDVLRTVYKSDIQTNFDGAAQGAVEGIARLDGIRNVQHTATEQTVSGKPARRLSITAERWRKALRVEGLLISDGQAYWQVQAIFDPANAQAAKDAERLLKSVQLAP
jgi:hypothetical protein